MSTLNIEKTSIVHWFPDLERHKCGYCKNVDCSVSYGMWAEQLTVEDYQLLIDRGWRRSGKYCYKPIMDETCCPQYTIRCEVSKFSLSKSQKKIIKRFNKFVNDDNVPKDKSQDHSTASEGSRISNIIVKDRPDFKIDFDKLTGSVMEISPEGDKNRLENVQASGNLSLSSASTSAEPSSVLEIATNKSMVEPSSNQSPSIKHGVGADPTKPPRRKAKLIRLEKKQQRLLQRGMSLESLHKVDSTKSLEQFLNEIPVDSKQKFKIKLVPTGKPDSQSWENTKNLEFELYKKYQMVIHNDPPSKCSVEAFTRFLVNSPLKVTYERMSKNHPLFKKSAKLWEKYQMAIHNEVLKDCDQKQFREFLVDTPLKSTRIRGATGGLTYGSYHQQYWLDDKLIAVGVVDILPRCISSVYFFYDPDYKFLTLGTYGSMREVQFVRGLHENVSSIEYYYMGYYIHSCPKMRYKGKLSCSYLLCPETYNWFLVDGCTSKLDANKYSRLNPDLDALDENICTDDDIDRIKVLVGYSFTNFGTYKYKYGEREIFANIGRLIGKKLAGSLLFVSSNE